MEPELTMRSRYGDVFNHDEEADGYDVEVRNEKDPIRTVYGEVLRWLASTGSGCDFHITSAGAGFRDR
jgi:hypothetical protein